MSEDRIDSIFREKLGDYSAEPSPEVWSRIAEDLDSGKKGVFAFWRNLGLIALGLAFLVFVGYEMFRLENLDREVKELRSEVRNSTKGETKANSNLLNSDKDNSPAQTENTQVSNSESIPPVSRNNAQEPQVAEVSFADDSKKSESKTSNSATTGTGEITKLNSFPKKVAPSLEVKMDETLPIMLNEAINMDHIQIKSVSFPGIYADLNRDKRPFEPFKPRIWTIGAYALVNFNRSDIQIASGGPSFQERTGQTQTLGGGVSISRNIWDNLRLTSGLEYSKWCMRSFGSIEVQSNQGFVTSTEAMWNTDQIIFGATGPQLVNLSSDTIPFDTQSELFVDTIQLDLELEECLTILSIPLSLEYELRLGRWTVLPGLGLNYDRIINRSSTNLSENAVQIETRPSDNGNNNQLSYHLSLALEYGITERWSLRFRGRYRDYLTPVYRSDSFSTYPFLYSGDMGLTYRF